MRLIRHGFEALLLALLSASCGGADTGGLTGGKHSDLGSGGTVAFSTGGGETEAGGAPSGGASSGGAEPNGGAQGAGGAPIGAACTSDLDCGAAHCETTIALRCVECLNSAHCANGSTCRAGVCEVAHPCTGSADCMNAPDGRVICDPGSGECVQCASSANCAPDQACISARCAGNFGAGGAGSSGGATGSGGAASSGGSDGAGGSYSPPDGAWKRCRSDSDCVGDRTCTAALQIGTQDRDGACVKPCVIVITQCDALPPGPGGQTQCTVLGPGVGLCTISCSSGDLCPDGFDCLNGYCYWKK